MDRVILHCDCNGFFASVEAAINPELRNVPMAVGGSVEARHGIILAKTSLQKNTIFKLQKPFFQQRKNVPLL